MCLSTCVFVCMRACLCVCVHLRMCACAELLFSNNVLVVGQFHQSLTDE